MFTPGCEFDHNHLSLGTLQRRSASESNMATAGQHGGRTPCLGGSPCSNMEDAFHYRGENSSPSTPAIFGARVSDCRNHDTACCASSRVMNANSIKVGCLSFHAMDGFRSRDLDHHSNQSLWTAVQRGWRSFPDSPADAGSFAGVTHDRSSLSAGRGIGYAICIHLVE